MREFPYSRRLLRIVPFEQRSLLSISDGETNTAYTYDSVGRLATVTSQAGTTTYSYDVYGNLAKVVTATGSGIITTTYEYDLMNRLTRLTNFSDANNNGVMDEGEGVSQFDYTLDTLGKKTHATETFWFDNNEDGIKDANVNNIDWTYDQQSRLIREVFDHYDDQFDQTLEWTYDEVGNRLTQNLDKGNDSVIDEVTRYYIDANDRLIDELFDGQHDGTFEKTTHYDYDKTQQTVKTVTDNGVITDDTSFEYNALGQMAVVTIIKYTDGVARSIERTTYGYGSDGIRVSALHEIDSNADGTYDTATLTEYLNDPNNHTGYSQVLKTTEYSIDGEIRTITKEIYYTIGLDQIAQSITAYIDGIAQETETHYFTYDGHGSTRALFDATAAIIQLYSFDAYGNALGFNPTDALTEYLYSGEQFDSKIGQQYLRARYYDPVTGRFNSLDSFFGNLDDPQSLHKYLYTHADPVNGIDPSGMMTVGAMMVSIGNMLNMTIRVMKVASKIYNAVNTIHFIGELYSQLAYGGFVHVLRDELWSVANKWGKFSLDTVTAKLFNSDLWKDAASTLVDNLSRIMSHIFIRGVSILKNMSKPGFQWLLYMPTPWEAFIPNITLAPIKLPALKLAGAQVAIKFGGGGTPGNDDGKFRGRLFGFGTELKSKNSERLLFRLDYHPLHGHGRDKSDADYVVSMGYYGNTLHIHLKK